MEKRHLQRLQQRFPGALSTKRVVCLHIADDYRYMDEELIDRLRGGVDSYLDSAET